MYCSRIDFSHPLHINSEKGCGIDFFGVCFLYVNLMRSFLFFPPNDVYPEVVETGVERNTLGKGLLTRIVFGSSDTHGT